MNPRKTLTILSLLSAAGLLLVACGGTPAASSTESSVETVNDWETPDDYVPFEGSEADLTAHVTVWHTFGSGSSANFESISQIATEFMKRYPNIEIELVNHTSYDQIYADLRNAIPAGTTPTMAIAYPDHVAEYLYAGAVENMAGYVNDPIIGMGVDDETEAGPIDDYYEAYLEESSDYAEPGVYSMPWSKSTEIMFYNKTYFDANGLSVPQTWDDLWNVSEQIKALNSNVTPFGYDSDDNLFITRCAQDDIPYTSSNENDRYLFDNDQAKAMVKELKEKYDEGLMITKGSSANSTYTSTMFTNQELYLTVGSTGGTNYNYTSAFDIGISAVPQSDTSDPKVISQGPSMCFFSSASQDELYAGWLFYKFATNANNTANLATLTGYNPVRRSAFDTDLYKNWSENTATTGADKLIKDVLEYADANYSTAYFVSPAFRGSAVARTEVGGIITNVLLADVTAETIDSTIDDAFELAYNNAVTAGN